MTDTRFNDRANMPLAHSGHLATIACTLFKFRYDPIQYTRELIRVPDGGTIAVDITPPTKPDEQLDNRPLLVVSQCVPSIACGSPGSRAGRANFSRTLGAAV